MLSFIKKIKNFSNFSTTDTIYALATGTNSAISIVRIGGPQAYKAFTLLSPNKTEQNLSRQLLIQKNKIKPRYAHSKSIYTAQGKPIDKCIMIYFQPQSSFNGEQTVQFHIHGSKAVAACLFKQLSNKNFRIADRGEFTKRALINGKINMIEAEALNDLIRSQTEFERQIAMNGMMGKNEQFLEKIKNKLILCLANNQAYIDFQEDQSDVKHDLFQKNKLVVKNVLQDLNQTLKSSKSLQHIKDGINVAIVGRPNVGKSTLINAMTNRQIAIVSGQPGTTRDILHAQVQCGGATLNLFDTAGLRETSDDVENQGIRRAKDKIKNSHFVLLVIDLKQEIVKQEIDDQSINVICNVDGSLDQQLFRSENTIVIINKADILLQNQLNAKYYIKLNFETNQTNFKKQVQLVTSFHQPQSIQTLKKIIEKRILSKYPIYNNPSEIYFTRQRCLTRLQKCIQTLQQYQQEDRPDIGCEYLRMALREVQEMLGRVDVQDMLDVLFRQFCVGK